MDFRDPPPSYHESDPLLQQKSSAVTSARRSPFLNRQQMCRKPRLRLTLILLALSFVFFFLGLLVWFLGPASSSPETARPTVSIAIIGAGPAGIAAAYTLSQEAKKKKTIVNITVFEKNYVVGGRLRLNATGSGGALFPWDDRKIEDALQAEDVAGSGLLWGSKTLRKRAKSKQIFAIKKGEEVGYFNGEKLLSKSTRPISETSWSSWLGQIYIYGPSVWRARSLPSETIKTFSEILHAKYWSHGIIEKILSSTGIDYAIGNSAVERLRINGISDRYVAEVIAPQIAGQLVWQKVNEINDLALSMAMDREDQGELHSGGKVLDVLEDMMGRSGAIVKLMTEVIEFKREELDEKEEKWILVNHFGGGEHKEYSAFDKVIVAAPWDTASHMSNVPFELERPRSKLYISLYTTFVSSCSELSTEYFGIASGTVPKQILNIPSPEMGELEAVREIAHVRDVSRLVDGKPVVEHLYRILSSREISNWTIYPFFQGGEEAITWMGRSKIENAYPLLYPRTTFPLFKLQDGLWHTNAIESVGSSIDLSWVAGENVARMVMDEID